jgi:hypothetical protein
MKALHLSLLIAVLAAPALAQTPAERAPRLVPWTAPSGNTPGQFFLGVVNPETTAAGMVFTLDATMTTPLGSNYYGIGLKLRTLSAATFRLVWQRGGQPDMNVELLGSTTCDNVGQAIMLTLGAREGMRQTGRDSPGAGLGPPQVRMNAGQPTFMYECETGLAGTESERRIRVLMPEQQFQLGGRLAVRALYQEQQDPLPGDLPGVPTDPPPPIVSDPLVLTLQRGRPKVLVVGESVAWGQGIPLTQKASFQVFLDMVRRYEGQTVSFTMKAHSGATINRPDVGRIADVPAGDCVFLREIDGEIPRSEPTIQCQLLDAVTRECFVDAQSIGAVPAPFFFCVDGLPRRTGRAGESRFNFDLGPSYDVVIMWACVNDVEGMSIVTGIGPDVSNQQLAARTATECDLRNGLADLRSVLPNAKIIVNEFQLITSGLTDLDRSGCGLQTAFTVFGALARGPVGAAAAFFATDAAINQSGARSQIFRTGATTALTASAAALNEIPATEERRGRGSVEFLDHPFFDPPGSAMWASNASLVFPLVCNASGILAAVDPVLTARVAVCARFLGTTATDPFRIADPKFMQCVRASAFHPTVQANNFMAARIITQRQRFYPRMLNFDPDTPVMVNPNGPVP